VDRLLDGFPTGSCLPALAAIGGDWSEVNQLESKYGKQALDSVVAAGRAAQCPPFSFEPGYPAGGGGSAGGVGGGGAVNGALGDALDGMGLERGDDSKLTVRTFLNRLLGLNVATQNVVFDRFSKQLQETVDMAKVREPTLGKTATVLLVLCMTFTMLFLPFLFFSSLFLSFLSFLWPSFHVMIDSWPGVSRRRTDWGRGNMCSSLLEVSRALLARLHKSGPHPPLSIFFFPGRTAWHPPLRRAAASTRACRTCGAHPSR
jgi:hypothetical protein